MHRDFLAYLIASLRSSNKDLNKKINTITSRHDEDIKRITSQHKEHLEKITSQRDEYFKRFRTNGGFGEYVFEKQMQYCLKQSSLNQYYFFSNVFFTAVNHVGEPYLSQIDHLLICDYGIFVFNTKYWRGRTLIYLSDSKKLYGILGDMETNYNGLCIYNISVSNDDKKQAKFAINSYGTPIKQVSEQADQFRAFLSKNISHNEFVEPVLSFVLPEGSELICTNTNVSADSIIKYNDLCCGRYWLNNNRPLSIISISSNDDHADISLASYLSERIDRTSQLNVKYSSDVVFHIGEFISSGNKTGFSTCFVKNH